MAKINGTQHRPPSFIDLFSGCGGLSLGFRWAGLFPLFSVERSEMAGETYYHNLIQRIPDDDPDYWKRYCENNEDKVERQLRSGLFIGPIEDLVDKNEGMLEAIVNEKTNGGVDIIAGGPPCQGFSCAGRRNAHDKRNMMPWHFLKIVSKLKPRAVVLENVGGFRHRFQRDGEPAVAESIQEALNQTQPGYVSQLLRLNAQHYGIPQHRPRIMIVALRRDVANSLGIFSELPVWTSGEGGEGFLAPPPVSVDKCLTVKDALFDIDGNGYRKSCKEISLYASAMRFKRKVPAQSRGSSIHLSEPVNHILRKHCDHVVCRFSLYQVVRDYGIDRRILQMSGLSVRDAGKYIAQQLCIIPDKAFPLLLSGLPRPILNRDDIVNLVLLHQTRKHSQRALAWRRPAPTIMTLPDDFVHPLEPRTLTVREMARIQSFPDYFEFRAKETTGGKNRRIEVPQYTQVGNAVPPLLAMHVGMRLKALLMSA
jgi:DNA (cytosine-5)-methyltransferase 1